jgi:hypothetical protein
MSNCKCYSKIESDPIQFSLSLDACLPVGRGEGWGGGVYDHVFYPPSLIPLPPVVATRNRGEGSF